MNDNEWIDLLHYLIKRLIDLGASDFANAVKQASTSRVIENPEQTFSLREKIPKSTYREVGELTIRLPTPKEAVLQAIELLRVRLEMFPGVSEALVKNLDAESANIVWKMETSESLILAAIPEFSASSLILSDQERKELKKQVEELSRLILQS